MKRGSMKREKSGRQALVAYLCRFRPEPEGGFTVTCPKLPSVVTSGEILEEAQANAREAIELCLEVMREDGRPFRPPTGISPRRSTSWCRSLTRTHESVAGALGPRRHRGTGAVGLR